MGWSNTYSFSHHFRVFKDNKEGVSRKSRSLDIPPYMVIEPKCRKTIDIEKCILCQDTKKEKLVKKPSNTHKLLACINERGSYENIKYKKIQNEINTLCSTEVGQLNYHRSCYGEATNKTKIQRDKHSYENNKDTPLDVSLSISNPHAFTRKNTAPYDKSLCFFCQKIHDSKGRDRLNEVETIDTGIKICNAVKRSDSDILKV